MSSQCPRNALNSQYDVVIIGYGPTGAVLANLLGRDGLRVLVLEKNLSPYPLPRAVHFDDETMRVFQAAGCAAEVSATTRINPGMQFVDPKGNLLLDWPRPQVVTSNGWNASFRFHQPDLEKILHNRVAVDLPDKVKAVWGATVNSIVTNGASVSLEYTESGSSVAVSVTAKYLVGCDGANSRTRRFLVGTPAYTPGEPQVTDPADNMEDLGFRERWLVIDGRLKRDMPHLGDFTVQTCDPERPSTYTRQPGNRRRWELALRADEKDSEAQKPEFALKFIGAPGPRTVKPDDLELERTALYTFKSRVANTWSAGRVAIAGDAAHLTPPFMGQGMCAGIRDASNLAWKLSMCVRRGHNPALLSSYGLERRPHARAYVETAMRLGNLMNTCRTADDLRNTLAPGGARGVPKDPNAKDEGKGPAKMKSITPPLGNVFGVGEEANRLAPQPKLSDGRWLDDVVGYAPVLMIDGAFRNEVWQGVDSLARNGVRVVSSTGEPSVQSALESVGGRALFVRPDRYILGTAGTAGEFEPIVKTWLTICEGCSPQAKL